LKLPLDGIVVLDLTRLLPGASATQILADFGAQVVKVEEPPKGDPGRAFPPVGSGDELFSLTNLGKKSIAINLKNPRGKDAFLRLVSGADVLVESFRPGVMDRLGLNYAELSRRNPKLIYVAISGYGQSGPDAALPGHDLNYQARSGLLDLMRDKNGVPQIPPIQLADLVGGALQAVVGVLLAIVSRSATGRGQMIDAAMMDGMKPLLSIPMAWHAASQRGDLSAGLLTGSYACYNAYKASDGKWISLGALEPKFWRTACEVLECEDFIDEQYSGEPKQSQMIKRIAELIQKKSSREWSRLLKNACVAPVTALSREGPGVWPVLSQTPGKRSGQVPGVGEHTREILATAGFATKEIEELEAAGVVFKV
jgi:crotonobetainyl-CoA:carnitine CoA-transferase CaiB-like acyl-CoA transferase